MECTDLAENPNHLQPGQLLYLPLNYPADSAQPLNLQHRPDYYVVGPGDTLSLIAQRLFGDSKKYHHIVHANNKLLDADKISPGTLLIIPPEQ